MNRSESAEMGLACSIVGMAAGASIAFIAPGLGYRWFMVAAPLAAFLSGCLLWLLLVVRPAAFTWQRGACAGAFASVLAHYLCWYLMLAGTYLAELAVRPALSAGQGAPNLIQAVAAAGVFAAWSLALTGWLTLPVGALLGAALASHQRRRRRAAKP